MLVRIIEGAHKEPIFKDKTYRQNNKYSLYKKFSKRLQGRILKNSNKDNKSKKTNKIRRSSETSHKSTLIKANKKDIHNKQKYLAKPIILDI